MMVWRIWDVRGEGLVAAPSYVHFNNAKYIDSYVGTKEELVTHLKKYGILRAKIIHESLARSLIEDVVEFGR